MINHIPLVGLLFGVALLGFGMQRNSLDLKLASLWTILIVTAVALVTFFTGEEAEDMLKNVLGPVGGKDLEKFVHPHEEAGLIFLITLVAAGILSAFSMFNYGKKKEFNQTVMKALMAVSIIALLLAGRTAQLGGQIRHTEVRAGAAIGGLAEASDENANDHEDAYDEGMPEQANSSK
jgi:hypothetical protein